MNSYENARNNLDGLIAFEVGQLPEEEVVQLFQRLIDDGSVWRMQGSYGRTALELIEAGECMLGSVGHRNYFGSYVPSRTEVEPGAPGSPQYVARHGSQSPSNHEAR